MQPHFFKLPTLAMIRVTGKKAATFLQGQLTCDMQEITPTQSRLGAHCSHKGRVLTSLRVVNFQDQLYLILPETMVAPAIAELKKYAMLSRVSLEKENQLMMMGCYGAELHDELLRLFKTLPEIIDSAIYTQELLIVRVHVHDIAPRYLIMGLPAAIGALEQHLSTQFSLGDDAQWRLLDIQAGVAVIYSQTADLFTPQMLNYPELKAVSFKKGCYIGQEVIARTHYLGKAKRHLQVGKLIADGGELQLPQPGDVISRQDGQDAGVVVEGVLDELGGYALLAVVQDDALVGDIFLGKDLVVKIYL
jgi:folate-binding protein YgfZ